MRRRSLPSTHIDIGTLASAVIVVIGALAGLAFVLQHDPSTLFWPEPEPSQPLPAAPAADSAPLGPVRILESAPAPPIDSAPADAPSAPDEPHRLASRLAELQSLCDYWTQRNSDGRFMGFQYQACNDMQQLAARMGAATSDVEIVTATTSPAEPSASDGAQLVPVATDDCGRYGYGTIEYRQCRGREKNRLQQWCAQLNIDMQTASGRFYRRLEAQHSAVCIAADHYRIID